MSLPGPSLVEWGFELLALAGVSAAAGEGVRRVLARPFPWFRFVEPIEGALLDLYLGGALLYLLAAVPLGLFRPPIVIAVLAVAVAVAFFGPTGHLRVRAWREQVGRVLRPFRRPTYQLVALATAALFVVELAAITNIPTGNTFDSSVDATFTALLNLHGTAPLTLEPVASGAVGYPQGSEAFFGFAQLAAGLPAARVPLLVTPLFLALGPLGAFAIGRRWMGTDAAGAICALVFALLGPGTRYLAAGSNDFALAFPLVLLLAARSVDWVAAAAPSLRDAVAFGVVAGYSAALNPVGAEWLFLLLPIAALIARPTFGGRLGRWASRWAIAAVGGMVLVLPSLMAVLAGGRRSLPAGVGGGGGISAAQFVGWADPLLIGAGHVGFSPDLGLQIELAGLLGLGAILLLWEVGGSASSARRFGVLTAAGLASGLLWLGAAGLGGDGVGWAQDLSEVSSAGQVSLLLFSVYTLLGAYAIVWIWERGSRARLSAGSAPSAARTVGTVSPVLCVAIVALVLLPGAVATAALLPPENASIYHDFSRVTDADFAFLAWAPAHLPDGARVLVAPGSAAEFLPAYDPHVVLLYPMTGASWTTNASYLSLRALLTNGTLGAVGEADLAQLGVQYVAVTGNDTVLFAPFSPAPFLGNPDSPLLYENDDAYLFQWDG